MAISSTEEPPPPASHLSRVVGRRRSRAPPTSPWTSTPGPCFVYPGRPQLVSHGNLRLGAMTRTRQCTSSWVRPCSPGTMRWPRALPWWRGGRHSRCRGPWGWAHGSWRSRSGACSWVQRPMIIHLHKRRQMSRRDGWRCDLWTARVTSVREKWRGRGTHVCEMRKGWLAKKQNS